MLFTPDQKVEPERNPITRLFRRFVPVTSQFEGQRFVIRRGGRWYATPLLVALLCVETSDIIFAVDSVPAIFAISREPLIVFTSNVFAILGLRAMYFLLAAAVERFNLLKYALALVLIFVGLKMVWLNQLFDGTFPIEWSLGIIAVILVGGVVASLLVTKNTKDVLATKDTTRPGDKTPRRVEGPVFCGDTDAPTEDDIQRVTVTGDTKKDTKPLQRAAS
jgi:tellurite resistance protein TerC